MIKLVRPKKILIVKMSAIGDVIQTLLALNVLKRSCEDVSIDWLVEDKAAAVLEGHPDINRLIIFNRKQKRIRECIQKLRKSNYDWAIDFQGTFKSSLFMRFSKAHFRIGYQDPREPCSFLYNVCVKSGNKDVLHSVRNLNLLKQLGISKDRPLFNFPIGEKAEEKIENLLEEKLSTETYFSLNAVASRPANRWGISNFKKLIQKFREYSCDTIFLLGGSQDVEDHKFLADGLENVVDLTGSLSLKESAALLKRSLFFISGDTGPLHMAASVGCPVLGIYGPTNVRRTGPFQKDAFLVQKHVDCQPCYKKICPLEHHQCMKDLTVEEVLIKLVELWRYSKKNV
ncbi:hypothetical protein AB834_02020 [PVC group bacterium (ex Bugula neritina AB1)]|nr:hypothetical protein AB834_02020 [PVC group bacterium (ex Bugula neritina AB1)]